MSKDVILENMDKAEQEAMNIRLARYREANLMRSIKNADGLSVVVGKSGILAWYKGEKYLSWTDLEKALVG